MVVIYILELILGIALIIYLIREYLDTRNSFLLLMSAALFAILLATIGYAYGFIL
jgi:hypothetical protein